MILILHCNGWLLHDYGGIDTWEANRGFLVGLAKRTIQSLCVIVLILLYYLPDWGLIRYHSPFVIVSSVLLFYLFIRLPKFNNKVINWIGVSALSVFICHTCTDTMFEFLCTTNIKLFTNQTFGLYCFEMLGVNLCIFAVSILLDKLRLLLFKPLFYWTSKLYKI